MTEPISYQFEKAFLEKAKGISLADLLDCPATQCWTVSALGNATRHAHRFIGDMSPVHSHLVMVLRDVFNAIPANERVELFKTSGSLVHEGKLERHDPQA